MKYNYVIFGSETELYKISYADIEKVDYAKYLYRRIDTDSKILTFLYRIHTSPTTNRIIHLPLQNIWDKWQFKGKFSDEKPICFVFFGSTHRLLNKRFLNYLRCQYKDCKLVIFFQDLVSRSLKEKYLTIKDDFDLSISFDQEDARKYKMYYHPLVYSYNEIQTDSSIPCADVYFLGYAKNRLDKIMQVFNLLDSNGINCDFYLVGVPRDKQKNNNGLHYIDKMSYYENLKHAKNAKYLLEIMQENGHGFTIRYCEAIMLGKRLLTDNPEICNAPFFDDDKIMTFAETSDIKCDIIKQTSNDVDYGYKEELSPIKLLEFIDALL